MRDNIEITRDKFAAYVKVQKSGRTNMMDAKAAVMLSGFGLSEDEVWDIMHNYTVYLNQFGREEYDQKVNTANETAG